MPKIIYKSADTNIRETKYTNCNEVDITSNKSLSTMTKDELFIYLLSRFNAGIMSILYDENIVSMKPRIASLNLQDLPEEFAVLFFTSGTTGEPTGAFKSKENILAELDVLKALFSTLKIERLIVTVPLIHIYGFLTGVMLPSILGVDVVLKEEFLPHELITLAEEKRTLCITNPVFLKVLNKLQIDIPCPHITFVSSTGKLEKKVIETLHHKLGSNIYQLFGSTETGGIAYKLNTSLLWKPFEGVHIEKKGHNLSVESPFISPYIIGKKIEKLTQPFVTTDIVSVKKEGFQLLGRDSEIIKISGKRISLLEIESLLENNNNIVQALVKLSYGVDSHKDEQLDIFIESAIPLNALRQEVKKILQKNYKNINIRSRITIVEEIAKNYMGKKIRT